MVTKLEPSKIQFHTVCGEYSAAEVSDHLLSYDAQLSREIHRTLNQLERLQRMPQRPAGSAPDQGRSLFLIALYSRG